MKNLRVRLLRELLFVYELEHRQRIALHLGEPTKVRRPNLPEVAHRRLRPPPHTLGHFNNIPL